ncbi:PhzF family phenazine biosynthesis protein [Streptomyces kaniharaensis]|uniref:PhzF family phenazine biosynthesis protein n=1 Tax=Streptomyces kaniharaensis TaxID=212423 RepID=UPI0018A86E72|nr:PhzF family phenazine biosynthesis protein [Streptomyces kaniharaensis]
MQYDLADVFTDTALGGNQLAVFTGTVAVDPGLMQAIALEMNLSETVFLRPAEAGGDIRAKLYSTVTEVDFAGHPLLGTAAVLAQHQAADETTLHIETNVGVVPVTTRRLGEDRYTAWMRQPLPKVSPVPDEQAAGLLAVLGLQQSLLPVTLYDAGIPHLYVMADSPEAVRAVVPDFPALGRAAGPGRARINVFALTGPDTAVTRMFSPYDRVPEDPACGSAAGPLAAHLVRHGFLASGVQLTLSQGEAVNRPSTLYAQVVADQDDIQSIDVGGGVRLIGSGRLRLPGLGGSAARPGDRTETA